MTALGVLYLKIPILAAFVATALAFAQTPPLKRTTVAQADVSVPNHEAIISHVELAPGAFGGRHTHAGEEISYIIEGDLELIIEGKPTQRLKAGQGFIVPAGAVHNPHNVGTTPVKLAVVFYVEKGKPLATPAP
jgi:quercetin dioxygenase-like cupin family protein